MLCLLTTSTRHLQFGGLKMSGVNNLRRQGPANTFMNVSGHSISVGWRIEVKGALVAPVMHDGQSIKQHNVALLGHPAHHVRERGDAQHGFGARAVLHIHHDDVGAGVGNRVETLIEAGAEILRFDAAQRIDGARLPDQQFRPILGQYPRQVGSHLCRRLTGGNMGGHFDFVARQPLSKRLLQLCRVGKPRTVRARQCGGLRAHDADVEPMMILDFLADSHQIAGGGYERFRHVALLRRCSRGRAIHKRDGRQNGNDDRHASPPARSASGDLTRDKGLRPSTALYHESRLAAAIIMKMPNTLIAVCSSGPPEDSAMMNWPAKARNTPRQKTSSECWPQTMAGQRIADFRPGQWRGTKSTVTDASARKCANRRTSRLV